MRRLRARLAPGQRVLLVFCLAVVLGAGAVSVPDGSSLDALSMLWFSGPPGGSIIIGTGSGPGWFELAVFLVAIAAWTGLSVPLLAGLGGASGAGPARRGLMASLGMAQRAALAAGLGAALAATAMWANALTAAVSSSSSGLFLVAPVTRSTYVPSGPGLPGWAHALIWLAALAAWAVAAGCLLGTRPSPARPAEPASDRG